MPPARLAAPLLIAFVAGCATTPPREPPSDIDPTVVSHPHYHDPLSGMNRAVFAFNDVAYRYALIPLGKGYAAVVPDAARTGIGNFFHNVRTPVFLVNHVLQGRFGEAGVDVLRFGVNSTLGLLGFFDPAAAWFDLKRDETGFGRTLSGYGTGYGAYLVLPLIGPSNLRDGGSMIVDYFLHPVPYLLDTPESTIVTGVDRFQEQVPTLLRYGELRGKVEDPYVFFRNLHLQESQQESVDAQR